MASTSPAQRLIPATESGSTPSNSVSLHAEAEPPSHWPSEMPHAPEGLPAGLQVQPLQVRLLLLGRFQTNDEREHARAAAVKQQPANIPGYR